MSFDVFERRYEPMTAVEAGYDGSEGDFNVPHGIASKYPANRVWTVLDCDGKWYLSAGFHVVNRIAYIVCKKDHDFPRARRVRGVTQPKRHRCTPSFALLNVPRFI
jgi:hypothetical protein